MMLRKSNSESKRGNDAMPKFTSSHTLPGNTLTRDQVNELAQAAQNDPKVRRYRSFLNLSQGKIICVMEAPNEETLAAWFKTMNIPCDYITHVELEGDRGTVKDS